MEPITPVIDKQIVNCGSLDNNDKQVLLNLLQPLLDNNNTCKLDRHSFDKSRNIIKVDITNNKDGNTTSFKLKKFNSDVQMNNENALNKKKSFLKIMKYTLPRAKME